jgi:hypothetical protein
MMELELKLRKGKLGEEVGRRAKIILGFIAKHRRVQAKVK